MVNELMCAMKSIQDDFSAFKVKMESVVGQLSDECKQLKQENEKLQSKIQEFSNASNNSAISMPEDRSLAQPPLSNVVRNSVQLALQDEKSKREVIISRAEEQGRDQAFVTDLCSKINFQGSPTEVTRLGRLKKVKTSDANTPSEAAKHHRLLKVSFPSPFDARAFCSRFDEAKKNEEMIPDIRVRRSRTKDEQAMYKKSAALSRKLNEEAKSAGQSISYSIRENYSIWKFTKNENGKWTRDENWSVPTNLGNSIETPQK